MKILRFIPLLLLVVSCSISGEKAENRYETWSYYLGDPSGSQFTSLDQFTPENLDQLEVAWIYEAGGATDRSVIQTNPLIANNMVYGIGPNLKVFAVDAATGEEVWARRPIESNAVSRGLMYWADGDDKRILVGLQQYVAAFDALTGELIKTFGNGGLLDLKLNFDRDVTDNSLVATSPGVIYQDILIQGFMTSEDLPAVPGDIRGYDVRTGALLWTFHTIPRPGEFGAGTFPENAWIFLGGANNWAGMTLDDEAGIVYVPTGSAAFDFWGGNRPGDNLFANSLIALDAKTGQRLWHYQTVKHDIWDRDLPSPPNLVTITKDGKTFDAVAQPTKSGHIFIFDRKTGEPIYPIEEVPVFSSQLDQEIVASSQALPALPPPVSRQNLSEDDLNDWSVDYDSLKTILSQVSNRGQFDPPSTEGTVIFPGFDGGAEWGGSAYNPETGWLYVNANEMPWVLTMVPLENNEGGSLSEQGRGVYESYCMMCHGAELQGTQFHGNALPLVGLNKRLSMDSVLTILNTGRNEMPAFSFISDNRKKAVAAYLMEDTLSDGIAELNMRPEKPYGHKGYIRFVDSEGYPAVKPPWGTLNAIDLNSGKIMWQVPLGEVEELKKRGISATGTENYGGPIVTSTGLVFIASTPDKFLRAFDARSGAELWRYKLPFASMATPAMYEVNGRQFLVLAAGGGKISKDRGGLYMAFSLPDK